MKLLDPRSWRGSQNCRVLSALFYSTKIRTSSKPSVDSLYRRVSRAGDPKTSITQVLEDWVEEGRDVKEFELQRLIKQLRKYRRFTQALQVSDWMKNERNHELLPRDIAIRLDLVSKVHGLERAEKYFDSIPSYLRMYKVYGALLNCYAAHKSLEKAEALMQRMKEEGFLKTSLSYNVMLNLYSQLGKHEKLDSLMQEMEDKGIPHDRFTYNIKMNSYATTSDFGKMENLLMKMEADPHVSIDWHAYFIAANGFLKAGLFDKCKTLLKKSEQLVHDNQKWTAYECLLTLYASIGSKDEVYRIWNLYKSLERVYNSGYLCMLASLMKLNDIDGAERILKEWESTYACFDIRVPNMMISIYCKMGLLEKAEAFINRLTENGVEPPASTWGRLATGYFSNGHVKTAVETLKKAIFVSEQGWIPSLHTFAGCIEHLKASGDVEVAKEILLLIKERNLCSEGVIGRLEDYLNCESPNSWVIDLIKQETQVESYDHPLHGESEDRGERECEDSR